MYSCSFCGLMLPYPWDLFRNVQAVCNVYKKWKWQIWWKFTKGLMKTHMKWIQYFLQLCHFTSRTSWDLSWILLTVIICFSGRKWYWGEKKEKTEARLNGESLYYYIYINCIIITSYLFIYLFQTLLEQIKRRYGNNYSGLPFEKIKTTIGLNSKLNTISSYFTAENVL